MVCAGFSPSGSKEVLLDGQESYSVPACLPWSSFVQMAQELKLNNMRYRKGFVLALTEGCRRFVNARSLKKGMCVRSGEG